MNGVLIHFVNAVLSGKITFLWNCLKLLTCIHQQLTCISLKEKQSVPHFNSLCEANGVFLHILNAVVSEKITFLRKCLKLLSSIQQKFTCVSLTEKLSVPTLQFTVRSEWSVASLSKCCPFRENHFPLKVP